jgi:hypothetical protein
VIARSRTLVTSELGIGDDFVREEGCGSTAA